MNVKNLEYLKESLKYLGFGDKLNADLEKNIKDQTAEFKLNLIGEFTRDGQKERVYYALDFKKSGQTDMYFLNRYNATLKQDDPEKDRSQTFYISRNSGITAKEAYNLLSGRAVNKDLINKEGQPYNAWLQLDFNEKDKNDNHKVKQFHQGYGYDLDAVVNRYPIKELRNAEEKVKLVKSLEKGNLQPVTFVTEGREAKMYVSANPQYKTLDLYDSKMEKQFQGIEKRENREPEKSKEKKDAQMQNGDEESEGKKEKKSRRKGVGV